MLNAIFCADADGLGRVDPACLSEQTRMEILFSDVQNIKALQDAHGEFLPLVEWPGLRIRGHVEEIKCGRRIEFHGPDDISIYAIGPGGSIDLHWIPSHVVHFSIIGLHLHGTIDTAALPETLAHLGITENNFRGPFALENLPKGMERIEARGNLLDGTLNFSALPSTMLYLDAAQNNFSGTIDLTALPESMRALDLSWSEITGTINIEILPAHFSCLKLERTKIEQSTLVFDPQKHGNLRLCLDKAKFNEIVDADGKDTSGSVTLVN